MAQVLTDFEWPKFRPPGAKSKYPYETWLDGQTWLLEFGKDFETVPRNMRGLVSQAAKRYGVRAKTALLKDGNIVVRALPLEEKPAKGKR